MQSILLSSKLERIPLKAYAPSSWKRYPLNAAPWQALTERRREKSSLGQKLLYCNIYRYLWLRICFWLLIVIFYKREALIISGVKYEKQCIRTPKLPLFIVSMSCLPVQAEWEKYGICAKTYTPFKFTSYIDYFKSALELYRLHSFATLAVSLGFKPCTP